MLDPGKSGRYALRKFLRCASVKPLIVDAFDPALPCGLINAVKHNELSARWDFCLDIGMRRFGRFLKRGCNERVGIPAALVAAKMEFWRDA